MAATIPDAVTDKVDSKNGYQDFYLRPRDFPKLTPVDMSVAFPNLIKSPVQKTTPNQKKHHTQNPPKKDEAEIGS